MKRLFYTVVINVPERFEPNQQLSFPYVPAIEGKTIVGISTYNFNNGGANRAINGNLLFTKFDLSFVFVNFSNKENNLMIQDYPYNAFVNTEIFSPTVQDKSIKQPFAFTFSSKFSYVVNKSTNALVNSGAYSLQFQFEYLDK